MKTVGEILKKARLEKEFSLEQVENATKIRKEFLRALEEDNFSELPSYASARGFLKNYAEFLDLSPAAILAIFRRDFGKDKQIPVPNKEVFEKKIKWTPRLTLAVLVVIFFLGLSFYLIYQYFSLEKPPFLEVIFPPEGKQVFEEAIEISGRTQADALVTINDVPVLISPKGEFRYQFDLFPGENKIIVIAKNRMNKQTRIERTIFRLDK